MQIAHLLTCSRLNVPHRSGLTSCVLAWRVVDDPFFALAWPFVSRLAGSKVLGCILSNSSSESGYLSVVTSFAAFQCWVVPGFDGALANARCQSHAEEAFIEELPARGIDARTRNIEAGGESWCRLSCHHRSRQARRNLA